MEQEKKNKTIVDKVWDVFASVKLAVVIFALIALTSIVGTVLEQQAEPEKNLKLLAKMFGESAAPGLYRVFESLGFLDMYHSWWFLAFLLLFAANLIICSLDRLPRILKLVREKVKPLPSDHIEKMAVKKSVVIKGRLETVRALALSSVGKIGFRPAESATEKAVQYYAEKGNYTRLGVYITHLSILVIMAGALIGVFWGYNAMLNLPEGATSSFAYKGADVKIPLGFDIKCENFETTYYEKSDMPKAFTSWLAITKNGQVVARKRITVNDPLSYEGVTFYQSGYGTIKENIDNGIVILRVAGRDGMAQQLNVKGGEQFVVPGTGITARVTNFSPALAMDGTGNVYTYGENMTNPGIFVEMADASGKKSSGWILKRYPETWNLADGGRIEFLDYWGVEFTGLQVRKDPGVGIVYLGCIVMSIGLFMTFFMSHTRIWVQLEEAKGGVSVRIGGSANRNRATLERKVERLVSLLEAGSEGGK